jgi:hypothetical protein
MASSGLLPVNFTISETAKQAVEKVRADYDAAFPHDPAAVLCVAWGIVIPKSGPSSENVVVGYYQQSMLPEVAHGIQEVSGVKLVFFTTEEFHGRFAGKVLDYAESGGFFLREP